MKFKYLKETPQTDDNGLDFGHKEIVSTLKSIVANEEQNLTIGLFGSWGTGKSSIVESLKKRLKDTKVPLVIFDVWKHEGDALRRTFLIELIEQLYGYGKEYFKEDYLLSKRVNSSQNNAVEGYSVKWSKVKVHFPLLVGLLVVLLFSVLIVYGTLRLFFEVDLFKNIRLGELSAAIGAGLSLTVLFKYVDYFVKSEKVENKEERFQDPHEFEIEFGNIISNLKSTSGKIVITFDNLDRVSGDNALKIISTIKTFLDYRSKDENDVKTVFFLIPCDVDSMKAHISFSGFSGTGGDAKDLYWDEFLRKFFNTSIWIPDFHGTDLEKFAIARLDEVGVKEFRNNDHLSWLIIKVFNKNPRQIIQFINILLSNFLLLKDFCESGAFHDKLFYKNNVPQLAKFLLIKHRHPQCLEAFKENGAYQLSDEDTLATIDDEKFRSLLRQTEDIFIPSLEPYFKFRISKSEQQNLEMVRLVDSALYTDDLKYDIGDTIDFERDAKTFNGIVKDKFSSVRNPLIKAELVNFTLFISIHHKVLLHPGLYRELIVFLTHYTDSYIFYKVKPQLVMEGLFGKAPNMTQKENDQMLDSYIHTLERNDALKGRVSEAKFDEQARNVFEMVATYTQKIKFAQVMKVKDVLEKDTSNPYILEIFLKDDKVQEVFISEVFKKDAFANFRSEPTAQVTLYQLDMLMNFNPRKDFGELISKLLMTNFNSIFSPSNMEELEGLMIEFSRRIAIHLKFVHDCPDYGDRDETVTLLNRLGSFLQERIYVEIIRFKEMLRAMLLFENSLAVIKVLTTEMLLSNDPSVIMDMLDVIPDLKSLTREDNGDRLTDAIITFEELEEFIQRLPDDAVAILVNKYIREGKEEKAKTLIIKYRDNWEQASLDLVAIYIIARLTEAITPPKPKVYIDYLIDILMFVTENNANELERLEFWNPIFLMLVTGEREGSQTSAYDLLDKRQGLLTEGAASWLQEHLINRLNSHGLYDDYLLIEAIKLLTGRYEQQGFGQRFLTSILAGVIPHTISLDVFQVSAHVIERDNYNISEYLSEIHTFLERCEQMNVEQLIDARTVLIAIQHKLKGDRSQEAKDIRSRIRALG